MVPPVERGLYGPMLTCWRETTVVSLLTMKYKDMYHTHTHTQTVTPDAWFFFLKGQILLVFCACDPAALQPSAPPSPREPEDDRLLLLR